MLTVIKDREPPDKPDETKAQFFFKKIDRIKNWNFYWKGQSAGTGTKRDDREGGWKPNR